MPRIRLMISKEAQDSLMELQRKMKKPPAEVINELLVGQQKTILDDDLCKKEFFSFCIIYQISMPFCFPYECEFFNINSHYREIRFYLERVPKRYVIHRLSFNTQATIIIELDKRDFPKNQIYEKIKDKIIKQTKELAFNLLKKTIIHYRRLSEDYYNIGTIKPPMILEEFDRNVHVIIIRENEYFSTIRFMPVKEGSEIVIMNKLDNRIRNKIIDAVNLEESDNVFFVPYEFFDQSNISYYDEEWNLCLIQGVIAMESALSHLVLRSKLSSTFIKKYGSEEVLKEAYKDATGLPKKICRFLFPKLRAKKLTESEEKLRKLMSLISNKKTEKGIYDLRSKVVHEGLSVTEKEAKITREIVPQFFEILNSLLE